MNNQGNAKLEELFEDIFGGKQGNPRNKGPEASFATAEWLTHYHDRLSGPKTFEVGDLIMLGSPAYTVPAEGMPAIYMGLLDNPQGPTAKSIGGQYSGSVSNIQVGVIQHDGDFCPYTVCDRYFIPFDAGNNANAEAQGALLQELYAEYELIHQFEPGAILEWKTRVDARKFPRRGEQGIFIKYLEEPILNDEADTGRPHEHEPLDCVIGVKEADGGEYHEFFTNSKWFKPSK